MESRAGRFLVNFHHLTVSQRQVLNSIFAAANLILIWVNHSVVPWDSVHGMGTSHCFKNSDVKQGPKKIGDLKIRTLREGFQTHKNTGIFCPNTSIYILIRASRNTAVVSKILVLPVQCDSFFIRAHFCKNSGGIRAGYKQKSGQKTGTF